MERGAVVKIFAGDVVGLEESCMLQSAGELWLRHVREVGARVRRVQY